MVIRLGRHYGFRTINVVRRREQAEELQREGADAVVATNEESLPERVRALTEEEGVRFAMDAVGGATGSEVAGVLGTGGRMLVYGTLSGEPLTIDPRTLMTGQKRVEGFWMSEWVRQQSRITMGLLFTKLGKLIQSGVLATEVGATFPLNDVRAAVQAGGACRDGRGRCCCASARADGRGSDRAVVQLILPAARAIVSPFQTERMAEAPGEAYQPSRGRTAACSGRAAQHQGPRKSMSAPRASISQYSRTPARR